MTYIENPKLHGSGIVACIPQTCRCPNNCEDCFFQSGRSYLEPLAENLPNIPPPGPGVVRMNDGNDSNVQRDLVIETAKQYERVFFNTAIPRDIAEFNAPVVLTVNPGWGTNHRAELIDIPDNLMFVRFRTNTWNLELCDEVVNWYTPKVPVILTFMAYSKWPDYVRDEYKADYRERTRTLNPYFAITRAAWRRVMDRYDDNVFVYSCSNEDSNGGAKCARCGNCIREFFVTTERMRNG